MNRLKSATHTPLSIFIALIGAAVIAAGGGVQHAMYKNRQVKIKREIEAIERRIEQYKLDIRTIQMRSETSLNRFAIRKQLEDTGSSLRAIPPGLAEEVNPAPPAAVASAIP
ncbi:MAG: hypothetical protein DVB26_03685 [Verrucomicrobia bacterium]|nr:MAG: hypothetical protein DVB26_03685 [Verrucomicrobiota bacterium]